MSEVYIERYGLESDPVLNGNKNWYRIYKLLLRSAEDRALVVKTKASGRKRISVSLEPGEVAVSLRALAREACTGISTLQAFLKHLTNEGWVTTRIEQGITVITLLKFQEDTCGHDPDKADRSNRSTRMSCDFLWLTTL